MSFVLNDNIFGGGSGAGGGGSSKPVTLLSITTAPTGTFAKGSKYYDSTTKKIYTAKVADSWTGAKEETPQFGTIYIYDNNGTTEYYQWDGDNLVSTDLEKYQLVANKTNFYDETSQEKYPSSQALYQGLLTKQDKAETITIDTASVTIANIQANKNYVLSNANLTDITFTACETSKEVTTIEFTTGSTAPTFTDNSGIDWADGETPVFQSYQHYLIVIFNKIGFVKEIY